MKRCIADYDQAIRKYREDTEKLANTLSFATDVIIDCYSGRCGRTCAYHSLVCNGAPEKCCPKEYLPHQSRTLHPTEDDYDDLRQLINFRFSRALLTSTRYGTNTQKSEATHRGYSKSYPRNVTCARNFQPQIFSAIHHRNHGPGKSAAMICAALRAPNTEGTRCAVNNKGNKRNISRTKQGKGRPKTGPRDKFWWSISSILIRKAHLSLRLRCVNSVEDFFNCVIETSICMIFCNILHIDNIDELSDFFPKDEDENMLKTFVGL